MQADAVKFRASGEPAKIERFFVKLGEMEIPFEADRTLQTFTISSIDYVMTEALATVLCITLSAEDKTPFAIAS